MRSETGALLHDIGKLGVPEYIRVKPGRLTGDELAKIKSEVAPLLEKRLDTIEKAGKPARKFLADYTK